MREFAAMRGEEEPSDVERWDVLIFGMSRRWERGLIGQPTTTVR